jgi:hypothetical protein
LAGISSAADSHEYLAVLQGGENSIVTDTEDVIIITVHNPDPYLNITNNTSTIQSPVESLINASFPMNAVVLFSTPDTEVASMIQIENLSISDNNEYLILQVRPIDFYEGEVLTPYAQGTGTLHDFDQKSFDEARLYLEMIMTAPDNSYPPESACERCLNKCDNEAQCIGECDIYC